MSRTFVKNFSSLFLLSTHLISIPTAYSNDKSSVSDWDMNVFERADCIWDLGITHEEIPYQQAALDILKKLGDEQQSEKAKKKYIKKVIEYLGHHPLPKEDPTKEKPSVPAPLVFLLPSSSPPSSVSEFKTILKQNIDNLYKELLDSINTLSSPERSPERSPTSARRASCSGNIENSIVIGSPPRSLSDSFSGPDSPRRTLDSVRINIEEEIKKLKLNYYYASFIEILGEEASELRKNITQRANTLSSRSITNLHKYKLRYLRELNQKQFETLKQSDRLIVLAENIIAASKDASQLEGAALLDLACKIYLKLAQNAGEVYKNDTAKLVEHLHYYYSLACKNTASYQAHYLSGKLYQAHYLRGKLIETHKSDDHLWDSDAYDAYEDAAKITEKEGEYVAIGYSLAYHKLAVILEDPGPFKNNVAKDELTAIERHEYAAKKGHPISQHRLYQYYTKIEQNDIAIKLLELSAEGGYGPAQTDLGMHYLNKEGSDNSSYTKAAYWLNKAAQQNQAGAYKYLGRLYEEGLGVEKDYNTAFSHYRHAYKLAYADHRQDTELALKLGQFYEKGYTQKGVDASKAYEYYSIAVEGGSSQAHYHLGKLYFYGKDFKRNRTLALEHFEKAPLTSEVALLLGTMYHFGLGTEVSIAQAKKHLKYAAANNNIQAIEFLAYIYQKGLDGRIDPATAFALWEKGANLGSTLCAVQAGKHLFKEWKKSQGLSEGWKKAIDYFEKAPEDPDALYLLAYMIEYYFGIGLSNDNSDNKELDKAYAAYTKAAEKGHPGALIWKAQQYLQNSSVEEQRKAVSLFERAANMNYVKPLYFLARIYEDGLYGIEKDFKKALEYKAKARSLFEKHTLLRDTATIMEKGSQQALDYLQDETLQDNPFILSYLARLGETDSYSNGNYQQTIDRYRKAAELGSRTAARRLAMLESYNIPALIQEEDKPTMDNHHLIIKSTPVSEGDPHEILQQRENRKRKKMTHAIRLGKLSLSVSSLPCAPKNTSTVLDTSVQEASPLSTDSVSKTSPIQPVSKVTQETKPASEQDNAPDSPSLHSEQDKVADFSSLNSEQDDAADSSSLHSQQVKRVLRLLSEDANLANKYNTISIINPLKPLRDSLTEEEKETLNSAGNRQPR